MSKNSNNNNQSSTPNTPTRKRKLKGFKRVIESYRVVPMQASHLPTPSGKTRCKLCWLLGATTPTPGTRGDHFCRWNVAKEAPGRDPNPMMRQVPVYRWVKKGDSG